MTASTVVLMICAYAALESGRPSAWQWLLLAAVAVPIAVRGRWPLPVAAVTAGACLAVLTFAVIPVYASAVLCTALALTQYPVAVTLRPSRSVPALIVTAAALAAWWPGTPLVAVASVALPWLTGWVVRDRREAAERAAEVRTGRAVTEERLRIARDMHDTMAHTLSMISVKAGVARHVAPVRPEESAAALEVIENASREALAELRRSVGLLREEAETGSDESLRALATFAEQTGLQVRLALATDAAMPAEIKTVVYRVVQESLTNVVRHAAATHCAITVRAGPEAVTVEVVDDGTGPPAAGGHGLRGMRERIEEHGGTLRSGPRAEGGFSVTARIPARSGRP